MSVKRNENSIDKSTSQYLVVLSEYIVDVSNGVIIDAKSK